MSKPLTWLLAGAVLTFLGAPALATEQAARREADEDAAKAEPRAERAERREMRIYRQGDRDRDFVIRMGGDRADHLSDILQLRPEQEPALKAFLEATRNEGRHGEHMVKFDRGLDDRTTLQRLDDMQARMAEQQAEANRKIAAIKTFYGQLDARQKKAFDAMPMLMMVGPSVGPMMLPHRIPIAHTMPAHPEPPRAPERPRL